MGYEIEKFIWKLFENIFDRLPDHNLLELV